MVLDYFDIHKLLSCPPLSPPCTGEDWGQIQSFLGVFLDITLQNNYSSFCSKCSWEAGEFLFSALKWYLQKSCSVSCFILISPKFAQTALAKQLWESESDLSFTELAVITKMLFLFWKKQLLISLYFILQNGASLGWNKISNCCLRVQPTRAERGCRKQIVLSGLCRKRSLKKPWLPVVLLFSFKILLSVPNSYVDKHGEKQTRKEKLMLTYKFKLSNWPVRGVKQANWKPTPLTYKMTPQKRW